MCAFYVRTYIIPCNCPQRGTLFPCSSALYVHFLHVHSTYVATYFIICHNMEHYFRIVVRDMYIRVYTCRMPHNFPQCETIFAYSCVLYVHSMYAHCTYRVPHRKYWAMSTPKSPNKAIVARSNRLRIHTHSTRLYTAHSPTHSHGQRHCVSRSSPTH